MYFVGAGLISGAVVHHPLDPARYTLIGLVGAGVFTAATLLNELVLAERRPALTGAVVLVGSSLVLSFGIGMLSGGMQHFEEFPARAAALIPLGIIASFAGFVVRDVSVSWRRVLSPLGAAIGALAVVTYFALSSVASGLGDAPAHGDHGGGTSTTNGADTGTDERRETDSHTTNGVQPDGGFVVESEVDADAGADEHGGSSTHGH